MQIYETFRKFPILRDIFLVMFLDFGTFENILHSLTYDQHPNQIPATNSKAFITSSGIGAYLLPTIILYSIWVISNRI